MRHQAVAGAVVAALLAWFDIVGCGQCIVYFVEEQFKKLPKSSRRVVIKGGNHAGFGDYGIQAYDGERTISLEDQQSQVAKHLVAFLKRVRKRG